MKFSRNGINEIETLAIEVTQRRAYTTDRYVARKEAPLEGELGALDLRANFGLTRTDIQIISALNTIPNSPAAFEHCVGVIAHEVVHAK